MKKFIFLLFFFLSLNTYSQTIDCDIEKMMEIKDSTSCDLSIFGIIKDIKEDSIYVKIDSDKNNDEITFFIDKENIQKLKKDTKIKIENIKLIPGDDEILQFKIHINKFKIID